MGKDHSLRHILILDDDADYRNLLVRHLGELLPGVEITEYDPVAQGVPARDFDWSRYDVMLLDYNLSLHSVTGLEILKAHSSNPAFPATIIDTVRFRVASLSEESLFGAGTAASGSFSSSG